MAIDPCGFAMVSDDVGSYTKLTTKSVIGVWTYLRMSINNEPVVTPPSPTTTTEVDHSHEYAFANDRRLFA